jgi:hypothetical protein
MVGTGAGRVALVRWEVETGEHSIIIEADRFNHPKINPGGPEFLISARYHRSEGSFDVVPLRLNIGTLERIDLGFNRGGYVTGHSCWLGRTGLYHATLMPPDRGVVVLASDGTEPVRVAEGPYFWHTGASHDGRWIVADTNFPDEGIWLINVDTRKRDLLCFSGASQGHPQWSHPHPNLSDDGSMAVFTSDTTGITQVYIVYVPEDMRERLSEGDP